MTDSRQVAIRPGRAGWIAIALVACAALLVVLWRPEWVGGRALFVVAALAAVIVGLFLARRVTTLASAAPEASVIGRTDARSLPFALIVERATDPMLVVAGGERSDLNARRFLFANAAARELLRIQRA